MRGKNPLTILEIYSALTPSDSRSDWASESATAAFFLEIRVLFWPEISALGVFLNFDNERMYPLNTEVPPHRAMTPDFCQTPTLLV